MCGLLCTPGRPVVVSNLRPCSDLTAQGVRNYYTPSENNCFDPGRVDIGNRVREKHQTDFSPFLCFRIANSVALVGPFSLRERRRLKVSGLNSKYPRVLFGNTIKARCVFKSERSQSFFLCVCVLRVCGV